MLGIPASMEDEEPMTPDEVVRLPSKPQKTLITSFFKQKDPSKDALQKPKDLFGYFNKSKNSEKNEKMETTVCVNQMNNSLDDFQQSPKEAPTTKPKSHKKKKKLTLVEKNHKDKPANGSLREVNDIKEGSAKCPQSDTTVKEISYKDFLKSNGAESEDTVEDKTSTKSIQQEDRPENGLDDESKPEEMVSEISYEDFLKSCGKDLSAAATDDSITVVDDSSVSNPTKEADCAEMEGVCEYEEEQGLNKKVFDIEPALKPTPQESPRKSEIDSRSGPLGKKDIHCSKELILNAEEKDCRQSSLGGTEDTKTKVKPKGSKLKLQSKHTTTKVNVASAAAEHAANSIADRNGKEMTMDSNFNAVSEKASGDCQKSLTDEQKDHTHSDSMAGPVLSPKEKEDKDQPEVCESEVPCKSEEKPKQRGIAMFFKKVDPSEVKKMRKGDSSLITTKAVVHHLPAGRLDAEPPKGKPAAIEGKQRKSNVAVEGKDIDLSITQLGSEIIEVPEKKRRSKETIAGTPESPENQSDDKGTKVELDSEASQPTEEGTSLQEEKTVEIPNGLLSSEIHENGMKSDYDDDVVLIEERKSSPVKVKAVEIENKLPSSEIPENGIRNDSSDDVVLIKEQNSSPEEVETKREEIKARNAACIASLNEVKVVPSGNRKQATLSFSSKGLVMGKPVAPEPPKQVENDDSVPPNPPPRKAEVRECAETVRPKRKGRTQVNYSEDEVKIVEIEKPSTEEQLESRVAKDHSAHSKVKKKQVTSTPKRLAATKNTPEARSRKVLNSVFESSLEMTPPGPKRRAAIKLKFKRLKNPSSDEDFLTLETKERQQKVNQAQKLLTKAKLVQPKKKKSPVSAAKRSVKKRKTEKKFAKSARSAKSVAACEEVAPRRRSQRSSAHVAKAAISESLGEKMHKSQKKCPSSGGDTGGEKEKPKSSKKTPKRETKEKVKKSPKKETKEKVKKSPKKAAVKLASIFCKKKCAAGAIVISDDEAEVVDPEMLRVRKQFLMSGVPDTLRRQQAVSVAAAGDSDYPPFPTHSHVTQQVAGHTGTLNPWRLPPVSLNLRQHWHADIPTEIKLWEPGTFLDCEEDGREITSQAKEPEAHPCVAEEALPYLLGEISASNPTYPVRRTFKLLQHRTRTEGRTSNKPEDTTGDGEVAEVQDKPTKGKKRKKPEPEASPEKPTRQSKRHRASMESDPPRMSLRRSRRTEAVQEEEVDVMGDKTSEPAAAAKDQQSDSTAKDTKDAAKDATDAAKDATDVGAKDLLWTEKFEPVTGAEVLGNAGCVKKLKTWLVEWKQRTDLQLKRARKQIVKQAKRAGKSKEDIKKEIKKKLGSEWWADDDSDFELGSEDDDSEYEEEESSLCNSTLLLGPHGVGKTALVYALAKELGYKVFEVNASSRRSGRQMLAQLQEATQSHQVSKKNLDSMFTASMATEAILSQVPAKQEKKMPTAFANLFGKAKPKSEDKSAKAAKTGGKHGKEAKRGKNTKEMDSNKSKTGEAMTDDISKKGLDLSSTSLVLFEEVDVIFEEDKGFWAAIQTFMSTTKRPIILTSSAESVSCLVEGQHEQLTLRIPTLTNMATHLQLICLAENIRTSFHDLRCLVEFHRGDLRQCLLALQFWAQSNPTTPTTCVPVMYRPDFLSSSTAGQPAQAPAEAARMSPARCLGTSNTVHDSSSDFELTPVAKRRRCVRNTIEDESSMDSVQNSPCKGGFVTMATEDSQGVESPLKQTAPQGDTKLVPAPDNFHFPPLQRGCLEALSLTASLSAGMLPHLQEGVRGERVLSSDMLTHYSHHGFNLLYANLPSLLGLPCSTPVRRPSAAVLGDQNKARRRIKCATELFSSDDESDNEGFVSLKNKPQAKENSVEVENDPSKKLTENCGSPARSLEKKRMSAEDSILLHSVSSLSDMYDTFSFVDAHLCLDNELREGRCSASQYVWASGKVLPGLTNQGARFLRNDDMDTSLCAHAASCAQLAGVARCREQLQECLTHLEQVNPDQKESVTEKLTIPHEGTHLRLTSEFSIYENLESRHQRAYQYVNSVLPPSVQLSKRVVATDYIPALQTICRSEQLRKASNTKRRFLHYMDSISLAVTRKQHVLDALCSSFV